jgi:hypothetical protein
LHRRGIQAVLFEFPLAPGARKKATFVTLRFEVNLENAGQFRFMKGHVNQFWLGPSMKDTLSVMLPASQAQSGFA